MRIRKLTIENARSFLDRREMLFDGPISIIIGPNGGGKTNLLDIANTMLRRHLLASRYFHQSHNADQEEQWELRYNDQLSQMKLEKHSLGRQLSQYVALEIEVSENDIENMRAIQSDAAEIRIKSNRRYLEDPWQRVGDWNVDDFQPGDRITYVWSNDRFQPPEDPKGNSFLEYLQTYELDNAVRAQIGLDSLKLPMVYLPVNRAGNGFQSSVRLSGYNDIEQKRQTDAISSRSGGSIISLAIGRLAQKYRLLQEIDNQNAREVFYSDENLVQLSEALRNLGYEWELTTVNALDNSYDITLKKQGTSFLVSAASSGEREILTYLFAIYALNVRDAVIIVDEPELHLHPRWQNILFDIFEYLSSETGNQFILATHSPTFISPASIQYVSRVFIEDQKSDIVRLNSNDLPNSKHLFNIVNSQNNEKIFFTDKVVLVEGISDRIFFERVFDIILSSHNLPGHIPVEVVSIGGKGFFPAYQKLLRSCHVGCALIADLDYVEQVGSGDIKNLFRLNSSEIKDDVINNVGSLDGDALVSRIEEAMEIGSWGDARETWEYIKSRRRRLPPSLSEDDRAKLSSFLEEQRQSEIFILSRGALESYLPEGFRAKDLDKLIEFVASDGFWDDLPRDGRDEIEGFAKAILGLNDDPK